MNVLTGHRSILHVDLDAFFASVEQLDHPEYRGQPVLVGHDGRRGVVTAASYEARVYGCRSAQPMSVARRLCPHAIVARSRFYRYRELSGRMFSILDEFTPMVEPLSIDEAFLDITGTERLFGSAVDVAKAIRVRIKSDLGITASVGVAPNKFLAKLASDLNKPDGLTIIRADEIRQTLRPLAIDRIWGIGPKTAAKLAELSVKTIGDLEKVPADLLRARFGIDADRFIRLSAGNDVRSVTSDRQAKSVGQEQTFGIDLSDPEDVRGVLLEQTEQVGMRLRKNGLQASRITVKIRDGEFKTCTRSCTLAETTDQTRTLWNAARELFDAWAAKSYRPIRLIGASAGDLVGTTDFGIQLPLFQDSTGIRQRALDQVVDRLTARYGVPIVHRAHASQRSARHRECALILSSRQRERLFRQQGAKLKDSCDQENVAIRSGRRFLRQYSAMAPAISRAVVVCAGHFAAGHRAGFGLADGHQIRDRPGDRRAAARRSSMESPSGPA